MAANIPEMLLRAGIALVIAVGNIWLVYSAILTVSSVGAGEAQSDFELAYDLFRFGLPIFLASIIAVLAISLTARDKPVLRQPWSVYYSVNALIPVVIFFLV